MFEYIFVFFIVIVISVCFELSKSKWVRGILGISIVLILSIFGGVRDLNIGTDVPIYGRKSFESALIYDSFFKLYNYLKLDVGYLFLTFIISRFSSNINFFLFILQLICNTVVFKVLVNNKNKGSVTIGLIIYLGIYYCRTFNFLRQSLALVIVLYAYKFLDEDKDIKYIIAVLFASLFHSTALVALVAIVFKIISKRKDRKALLFIIFSISFVLSLTLDKVIPLLYNIGLLPYKYYEYIFKYVNTSTFIDWVDIAYKLLWIGLYVVVFNKREYDSKNNFYFSLLVLDFIIFNFRRTLLYTDRIALYFGFVQMFFIPHIIEKSTKDRKTKMIVYVITVAVTLLFWYMKFVKQGSCEVYPYTSQILNI